MTRPAVLAWYWLPVLAWMAVILGLSSQSGLPARQNPVTGDVIRSTYTLAKLAHVVEYSVLALLVLRAALAAGGGLRLPFVTATAWTVVAATAFGVGDELRQSLVPTREPSPLDVLIDGASACASVGAVALSRRLRERRRPGRRVQPAAPE